MKAEEGAPKRKLKQPKRGVGEKQEPDEEYGHTNAKIKQAIREEIKKKRKVTRKKPPNLEAKINRKGQKFQIFSILICRSEKSTKWIVWQLFLSNKREGKHGRQ